jgi:hypothetical protein
MIRFKSSTQITVIDGIHFCRVSYLQEIIMDADYDIFEIVKVIHDFWLFDAESYQRNYSTRHDLLLEPGFYVVNWPENIRSRRFNEYARYYGPFKMRKEAQEILESMRQHQNESLKITAVKPSIAIPINSRQLVKQTPPNKVLSAKVA